MRMEKLIEQRFSELEEKANAGMTYRGTDGTLAVNTEKFYEWVTSALNLLQRVFGEDSVHYQNLYRQYERFTGWVSQLDSCRGIFQAAKEDYEGGFLFSVRALIKAEVLADDVLAQAHALLQAGYKDSACVLAGVALETALKEMCTRAGISHGKLDRMNADLCKASVYNMAKQKQITAWAELRNKAAHGDWSAYSQADVEDFVTGVERFIGDYL